MKLGKFEILDELGRGGFGIVYKARDKTLNRLVAIKVLHPNLVNDPRFIGRFRQEAQIAANLDHPNLVPVHDFGEAEGHYYIVMGYMPSGSLKELLKREGSLNKERALEILQQIGAGLSYAHGQGVIHRDLKPGNILFDKEGKARVSDMGFAKLLQSDSTISMSASGGLVGTPAYMAPEIWKDNPTTLSVDVYSTACILVEMLTGEVLFQADSTPGVMLKHFEPIQLSEDLPQNWEPVIKGALEKNPEDRITSVADFVSLIKLTDKTPAMLSLAPWIKKDPVDKQQSIPIRETEQKTDPEEAAESNSSIEKRQHVRNAVNKPNRPRDRIGERFSNPTQSGKARTIESELRDLKAKSSILHNKKAVYIGMSLLAILSICIIFRSIGRSSGKPELRQWVHVFQQAFTPTPTLTFTPTPVTPTNTATITSTATKTPTVTPTPTLDGPFDYIVQADDFTCSGVAEKFNVLLDVFLYVNGLGLGDVCIIREGDIIKIPPAWQEIPTSTMVPTEMSVGTIIDYYVEPGATLDSVAKSFRSSIAQIIVETNRYRNANRLSPLLTETTLLNIGDLLKVPVNIVRP